MELVANAGEQVISRVSLGATRVKPRAHRWWVMFAVVRLRHLSEQKPGKSQSQSKGKDKSKHNNSIWNGEGKGEPNGGSGRSGQVLTSLEIVMITARGQMMDHGTGIQILRKHLRI